MIDKKTQMLVVNYRYYNYKHSNMASQKLFTSPYWKLYMKWIFSYKYVILKSMKAGCGRTTMPLEKQEIIKLEISLPIHNGHHFEMMI